MEHSSIDTYLASLDPFRQAYPSTSLPYPRYEAIPPNAITQSFQDLFPRTVHILEESTLSILSIRLSRQYRVIGHFLDTIAISTDNENPSVWSKILKRIYFLLPSKHRSNLQIEMENPRRSYRPSTECEVIDERASSLFRSINTSIQEYITECPANIFLGFGCFMRRKQYASVAKPTIVVHVHEGAQYNWPTVASFLATITKSTGIDFEIRPATIGNKALLDHFSTDIEKHCPSKPFNGAAIGVANESSWGTIGGSIVPRRPKERKKDQSWLRCLQAGHNPTSQKSLLCIVTNHHILEASKENLRTGFEFNPNDSTRPVIQYPSIQHFFNIKTKIATRVLNHERKYGSILLALDKRQTKRDLGQVLVSSGKAAPSQNSSYCHGNEHDNCADSLCQRCNFVESKDKDKDKLFPCGNSMCNKKHEFQDWAAFKISKKMMFVNKPPSFDSYRLPDTLVYSPSDIIKETADLEMNSYVIKQGAKTGVTCGRVIGEYHCLCTTDDLGSPGKPAKFLLFFKQHFVIRGFPESNGCFSEKGDSGSWIVDLVGRLVAMLCSGLQDGPGSLDVALPIKDTFEQIERKTGGYRVELPTNWTTKRDIWLAKAKTKLRKSHQLNQFSQRYSDETRYKT